MKPTRFKHHHAATPWPETLGATAAMAALVATGYAAFCLAAPTNNALLGILGRLV